MNTAPAAPAALTFLPWVRQGLAAAITADDTLGAGQPAVASLSATLAVNGVDAPTMTVRLRGPADVTGIDANQIVRTDPPDGSTDFEPSALAAIEFDRPDFPWLFTPARAAGPARLRPWLALVVVRRQPGVTLSAGAANALPTLSIGAPAQPATELPDLGESWAWAHAQAAASDRSATAVQAALQGAPGLSLSRLLCPRLLAPDTDYIACVVPAFEVGRKAGLGLPVADSDLLGARALAPAWVLAPAPAQVQLPVFHHWSFRTGADGDFASLVARLRPMAAPPGLGRRPIDVSSPGFALPAGLPPSIALSAPGALQPLSAEPVDPADTVWPEGTQPAWQDRLAAIVNAPGQQAVLAPDADPLLAPPLYGRWHARRDTAHRLQTQWFDQLNLDPRWRSVAALGTRVIQQHQEGLMASAWQQAGDLRQANQRLRQLQMGRAVGDGLQRRHLQPLPAAHALCVMAPMLSRVAAGTPGSSASMLAWLAGTPVPRAALGVAMRRLARPRGPLARRAAAQGLPVAGSGQWVSALNAGRAHLPPPAGGAPVRFDSVRAQLPDPAALRTFDQAHADAVAQRGGMPWFVVRPPGQALPMAHSFTHGTAGVDSPTARDFRRAAIAHLARVRPDRPGTSAALTLPADLGAAVQAIAAQTRPRPTAQALGLVTAMADPAPDGELRTLTVVPRFAQPMVQALRDLAPELLLPGLDQVPEDRVLGLQTHRGFVEAFLTGLNVEMARELLWRGFPTVLDGTHFDRFWGGQPDIAPLADWGNRALGGAAEPRRERFVLLLRSALLRRYPNAVIRLVPAVRRDGARTPSDDPALEREPIFTGHLPPDVAYVGFDIATDDALGAPDGHGDGFYVVIQQHPTEPRFGLHHQAARSGASHLKAGTAAPAGQPLHGQDWGRNGAHMAAILRRQPVRLAIHASQFLSPTTPPAP